MKLSPQDNSGFSLSSSELSNLFSGSANARDSLPPPGDANAAPPAAARASGFQGTSGVGWGGGGGCCLIKYRLLLLV